MKSSHFPFLSNTGNRIFYNLPAINVHEVILLEFRCSILVQDGTDGAVTSRITKNGNNNVHIHQATRLQLKRW